MTEQLQTICNKLDQVADSVLNYGIGSSYGTTRLINEVYGGYTPPMTGDQLAWYPRNIARRIRESYVNDEEPDAVTLTQVQESLNQWSVNPNLLQSMYTGSAQHAVPAYLTTLQYIAFVFEKPVPDWQMVSDKGMLPKELARKLRAIDTDIKQLTPKKEELEAQIQLIKEAHETADNLPIDLQRLKDANEQVNVVSKQASELYGRISDYPELIKKEFIEIQEKNTEAQKIVEQSREAYQITTSIGLAGAFDERAKASEESVKIWVVALIAALGAGIWIGHERITQLTEVLNKPVS